MHVGLLFAMPLADAGHWPGKGLIFGLDVA